MATGKLLPLTPEELEEKCKKEYFNAGSGESSWDKPVRIERRPLFGFLGNSLSIEYSVCNFDTMEEDIKKAINLSAQGQIKRIRQAGFDVFLSEEDYEGASLPSSKSRITFYVFEDEIYKIFFKLNGVSSGLDYSLQLLIDYISAGVEREAKSALKEIQSRKHLMA